MKSSYSSRVRNPRWMYVFPTYTIRSCAIPSNNRVFADFLSCLRCIYSQNPEDPKRDSTIASVMSSKGLKPNDCMVSLCGDDYIWANPIRVGDRRGVDNTSGIQEERARGVGDILEPDSRLGRGDVLRVQVEHRKLTLSRR